MVHSYVEHIRTRNVLLPRQHRTVHSLTLNGCKMTTPWSLRFSSGSIMEMRRYIWLVRVVTMEHCEGGASLYNMHTYVCTYMSFNYVQCYIHFHLYVHHTHTHTPLIRAHTHTHIRTYVHARCRSLLQGSHLLGMWLGEDADPLDSPYCNMHNRKSMILQVSQSSNQTISNSSYKSGSKFNQSALSQH